MVVKPRALSLLQVGVVACVLALTGCGTAASPAGTSGTSGGGTASTPAKAMLTITLTNAQGQGPSHWTLRCDPPGGTQPNPAAACSALMHLKYGIAELPPKHLLCPMIMVSSKEYIVTGTWFGKKVHRVIVDGGCDLSLFGTIDKVMH
jgi:Subtilisin inhibitor-like